MISCQKEHWDLQRVRGLTRGWLLRRIERLALWLLWLLPRPSTIYQCQLVLREV